MMTKDELKFLEAVGYGGYASALRQAQNAANTVTLPGAWVQPATRALGDGVCWLWRNVLAENKITVVAGVVGVGKSMLVAGDLAARVSVGSAWPDGSPGVAADVLIASGNDETADTLVPRLEAHGADLERVHFLEGWSGALDEEPSTKYWAEPAAGHGGLLPALAKALDERRKVRLVVIDPVSAFLDVGRGDRARAVLSGLQALARESSVAIVLVTHLRTAYQKGALAVVGADGLVAAARMAWVLTRDIHDRQRRLFLPAKNNLDGECPGFAWRLAGGKVQWEAGRVECGPAGELVDHVGRAREKRDALAAAFIADFLAPGPRMWVVIEQHGKLAGHRTGTLERVRSSVAEPFKRQEEDGRWLWRLIGDQRTGSEADIADLLAQRQVGPAGPLRPEAHGRKDLDLTRDAEGDLLADDTGDE